MQSCYNPSFYDKIKFYFIQYLPMYHLRMLKRNVKVNDTFVFGTKWKITLTAALINLLWLFYLF